MQWWPVPRQYPGISLERLRKTMKSPRITENRTGYIPNTSHRHYRRAFCFHTFSVPSSSTKPQTCTHKLLLHVVFRQQTSLSKMKTIWHTHVLGLKGYHTEYEKMSKILKMTNTIMRNFPMSLYSDLHYIIVSRKINSTEEINVWKPNLRWNKTEILEVLIHSFLFFHLLLLLLLCSDWW
jgi:hypothetical protein